MSGNGTLKANGKEEEGGAAAKVADTAMGHASGEQGGTTRPQFDDEDRRLPAALQATAHIAPLAAVGFTLLAYLAFEARFENNPLGGDLAVFAGALAAGLLWLACALLYRPHTTAKSADRRNYGLISERLTRLQSRIDTAPRKPCNGLREATYKRARAGARKETERVEQQLDRGSGMIWVTGLGYIALWHRVHSAERALIKLEDCSDAMAGAMHDETRLRNSNMQNKDVLLRRLNCAVAALDESKTCKTCQCLGHLEEVGNCHPTDTARKAELTHAKAFITLSDVRDQINTFRDDSWEGIVHARKRLIETSLVLAFTAYALLGIAIVAEAPAETIRWAAVYFLVGAIVGLFARARAEWDADTAVDDFGLSFARLIYTPWFSGLAAVGGVLIVSVLDSQLLNDGTNSSLLDIFSNSPSLLIIAAVFGLTPDLMIRRLSQQAETYKKDLQSTVVSQSTNDRPLTRKEERS